MPKYQGKYIKKELIGKGNYGVIYKVESIVDKKQYVAKHLSLNQIEEEFAQRQLDIIKKLRHPYIVQYIDSFIEDQQFIIIMQYCKEKDMSFHIDIMKKKNQYFSENLVINWVLQLVLGVQFIHSKKILHRDLKPQNIFIDNDMNIKIGDFGISKILATTSQQCKTMIGTPYYLAPQICSQDKYTTKADIWSLGCVIYQICSLSRPFQPKGGIFQLIQQIQHGTIKQIPSIYSKDLQKLVKKMMTRDCSKRPNTIQLLQDPLLVQLMIKNSSSVELKKQYPKTIKKPNLNESFIDKQNEMVHEQLKKFESQIEERMQKLKNKQVDKGEVDSYYKQVKGKMKQIQKAIEQAFLQLKEKSNETQKKENQSESIKSSSSQSGRLSSSQSTVVESVIIGQTNKNSIKKINKNDKSLVESASYQSVPYIESRQNISIPSNSKSFIQSIQMDESIGFKQSNVQNCLNNDSMQITLKSEYNQTIKQKTMSLAEQTINKLSFLKKTLQKNPNAIMSDSLLNFTLTLSEDELPLQTNLDRFSKNKISENSLKDTFSLDLTKKQIQSSILLPTTSKLKDSKNQKNNIKSQAIDDSYNYENEGFQDYQDMQEDQLSGTMNNSKVNGQRRKNQLSTIISFYQQTLNDLNQSELNQSLSPSQKMRNKYPLVMSEIKQQSQQGGSYVSRNQSTKTQSFFQKKEN